MRLFILAVGKVRDKAVAEACDGYLGRIARYQDVEVRQVRDGGKADRHATEARRIEGAALLRIIPPRARTFTLTRTGDSFTSEGLARMLQQWQEEARDVALVIGGAHGVDPAVLQVSEGCISLSSLTLPHEVARLVLLEQLYRACTINRGEPYHKGRGT